MKSRRILFLLVVVWIGSSLPQCFATGHSLASIEIIPITYNAHGTVLCKTRYSLNPQGVHAPVRIEYGWLVVSSTGFWQEHLHDVFDPIQFPNETETMFAVWKAGEEEWNAPFNWEHPPLSIQPLLQRYRFTPQTMDTGRFSQVVSSLITDVLNTCDLCERRQRSLHNATATLTSETVLEVAFYHDKIVFLRNVLTEAEQVGAEFGIPNFMVLNDGIPRDYGFDDQNIDGIFLLPEDAIETLEDVAK